MKGKIIKGVGGFYYVHASDDNIYSCRAKGIFRKLGVKPLPGDDVDMQVTDTKDMEGSIQSILPRKSLLLRPAVANVDQALVIFSFVSPQPNLNLLDTFLIHMGNSHLPCLICFNKADLVFDEDSRSLKEDCIRMIDAYRMAGYRVYTTSASVDGVQGQGTVDKQMPGDGGIEELKAALKGSTTTVAGPSGVGKSTIINLLQPHRVMETGEISTKIERGRHTTRHSELIYISCDTYIMDTPGFTSLRLPDGMGRDGVEAMYGEFEPYRGGCRFNGCTHTHEPGCSIKEAVSCGHISSLRYENYFRIVRAL